MSLYVLAFFANYLFIALKAFQQRNVAFDHYWAVVPTSVAMALGEVYVIAAVAEQGFGLMLVLTLGVAGGTGALTSMWLHRKYMPNGRNA